MRQTLLLQIIILVLGYCSVAPAQGFETDKHVFDSLYVSNRYQDCIPFGIRVLEYYRRDGVRDTVGAMKALKRLAYASMLMERPDLADTSISVSIGLSKPISNERVEILVWYGGNLTNKGMTRQADSVVRHAIRICDQLGSSGSKQRAFAYYVLGRNLAAMRQVELAERALKQSIQYYEAVPLTDNVLGGCYLLLSNLCNFQDRTTMAIAWMRKAERSWQALQPPPRLHLFELKCQLAGILTDQQEYAAADSVLRQLSAMYNPAIDPLGLQEQIRLAQAKYFFSLRQFDRASDLYQEAMETGLKINGGYTPEIVNCGLNCAMSLYNKGDSKAALQLVTALQDTLNKSEFATPANLGWFYSIAAEMMEDEAASMALLDKGLDQLRNDQGKIADNVGMGRLSTRIQHLLRHGEVDRAKAYFEWLERPDDKRALLVKGMIRAADGDWQASIALWKSYWDAERSEFLNRVLNLTDYQRIRAGDMLREAVDLFISHAASRDPGAAVYTELALDARLFTKSMLLSAAQKVRAQILNDPALEPVFRDWVDVREQLTWAYSQPKQADGVRELEERSDSLERFLARSSKLFRAAVKDIAPSWIDIRNQLKPGDAAIEIVQYRKFQYVHTDSTNYAVFVIRRDSDTPVLLTFEDADRIDRSLVEGYLNTCSHVAGDTLFDGAYHGFWKRLEPYLSGISRLYVSADGAFLKMNFGGIRLPAGGYVAEKLDIRHVFSLRDLKFQVGRGTGNRTAFLLGNPAFSMSSGLNNAAGMRSAIETPDNMPTDDYDARGLWTAPNGLHLMPLPGSEQEVLDIQALLQRKGWKATVVTGVMASEANIKSQKSPSIVHLATHGYYLSNTRSGTAGLSKSVLERNPMLRSMIFFAGAQNTLDKRAMEGEDGILTAYEAQHLAFDSTELVVLSACKTAQGVILNGEGVYGMQRALRIAGAEAVILSLWDVDDQVGRHFMLAFYEKWLGGMDKASAFRAAQMIVKKRYPHPFYWAGYLLMQ